MLASRLPDWDALSRPILCSRLIDRVLYLISNYMRDVLQWPFLKLQFTIAASRLALSLGLASVCLLQPTLRDRVGAPSPQLNRSRLCSLWPDFHYRQGHASSTVYSLRSGIVSPWSSISCFNPFSGIPLSLFLGWFWLAALGSGTPMHVPPWWCVIQILEMNEWMNRSRSDVAHCNNFLYTRIRMMSLSVHK